MEAVFRAEKREELFFLAVLADTHCVCFSRWAGLRVVNTTIAHAACVLVAIVLILDQG
jgi:hypothetical protein